jgi:arsenate reductase
MSYIDMIILCIIKHWKINMLKLLYICTHNRCRSILSEAITNSVGNEKLLAKSAGSQPVGEVHPLSIKYLSEAGYDTEGLSSESWDDFVEFAPDVVITVCDSAAGEVCPVYFSNAMKIHWGLSDPSKIEGTEDEVAQAFRACIELIKTRVEQLSTIANSDLSKHQMTQAIMALTKE